MSIRIFSYIEKLKYLNSIKNDILHKKIKIDKEAVNFGFNSMKQLVKVKNTTQIKGYPFKVDVNSNLSIGLKVVPLDIIYDSNEHPTKLEFLILDFLTENCVNNNISPHFVYCLGSNVIINKAKAIEHLNLRKLEKKKKIRNYSNIIMTEFIEGESLDTWVYNSNEISDKQWKIIVFQLIYTILIMQKLYKLNHNDFHYGNILMDTSIKPENYFVYKIDSKLYYIPNTGIIPKLFDFEFAMVYSSKIPNTYPNKFILENYNYDIKKHVATLKDDLQDSDESDSDSDFNNVPYNFSEFYDLHYFLTSLLDLYISEELFNWILKLYPSEIIPPNEDNTEESCKNSENDNSYETYSEEDDEFLYKGRLINGVENQFQLPTPISLLIDSGFFNEFLIKPIDFNQDKAIYFSYN